MNKEEANAILDGLVNEFGEGEYAEIAIESIIHGLRLAGCGEEYEEAVEARYPEIAARSRGEL